jgi:mono/diheme cytochrome c family protein
MGDRRVKPLWRADFSPRGTSVPLVGSEAKASRRLKPALHAQPGLQPPSGPGLKPRLQAKACSTLLLLALAGCRLDMQDQPKYKPLAASTFFIDGRSARPIPPGTIARDALNDTDVLHTGADGKGFAATIPMAVDQGLLERGQDRFDIYCAPCHGYLGDGDGMVARRGFKIPPSLHHERVRQAPPGYLFQVITNGYGAMGDYGDQVPPEDRWAIVAYIRALELARGATMADATPEGQAQLEAQP